ncbi:hypothetical protein LNV23_23545 [Paucibacter sp. DJ1R-11]|uniref:hypothetical protein n=1 Tax=Paucibacter sp. DJ1R-11 TaxID=2893556 RepID=UPI0021E45440|nr:hypothetical protein [Paucibacter sp. DJ1R-11]MCV2366415.1 hypothetical protein [Paucibacter sp. DJ1R-11]
MKRSVVSLALLLVLAIAADELRASIENAIFFRIDPQLAGSVVLLSTRVLLYLLIFLVAGALLSRRFHGRLSVFSAGLALGLLVLVPGALQSDFHPVHYSTHGPWWINALGWVNWFGPPVAGAVGAALAAALFKGQQSSPRNAA